MSKCAACGRYVSEKDGAKCTKCGSLFEKPCVQLSKSTKTPLNWVCPGCHSKQPRRDNTETLVKMVPAASPPVQSMNMVSNNCSSNEATLTQELMLFRQKMAVMCMKIDQFSDRMASMMALMNGVDERITGVESRMTALEERVDSVGTRVCSLEERGSSAGGTSGDITKLADTIEQLKIKLNDC